MSNFEQIVESILINSHITYIKEYTITTFRNGLYRFDFYLPEHNIFIECQGQQHYIYSKFFYNNRSDFLKAQERARRKCSYSLALGINLYCIPYWDIHKLKTVEDLFNPEYLVTSKFHNDIALKRFQNHKA